MRWLEEDAMRLGILLRYAGEAGGPPHGSRAGGRAARLPFGVGRRVLRHRCREPDRLGAGAHHQDQSRHRHHADVGAHAGLRRHDGRDAAGDVGQPLPAGHRPVGAAGDRGMARHALWQAADAHARIHRDRAQGVRARGAAAARGRALPDPLRGCGCDGSRQAAEEHAAPQSRA